MAQAAEADELPDGLTFVIVGHGPSVMRRPLGRFIDRHRVIRLKQAPMPDPHYWGTRTDVVVSRHAHLFRKLQPGSWVETNYVAKALAEPWSPEPGVEYWLANSQTMDCPTARIIDMPLWEAWWRRRSTKKMTTGFTALCGVAQFHPGARVGLIGFDGILHPKSADWRKWWDDTRRDWGVHDRQAENLAMRELGLDIIDLEEVSGSDH